MNKRVLKTKQYYRPNTVHYLLGIKYRVESSTYNNGKFITTFKEEL